MGYRVQASATRITKMRIGSEKIMDAGVAVKGRKQWRVVRAATGGSRLWSREYNYLSVTSAYVAVLRGAAGRTDSEHAKFLGKARLSASNWRD